MDARVLRLLIEQAATRRDDAAVLTAAARRDRDAAAATLNTLTGYREESLERGPVRVGQPVGVDQLRAAQHFDARLVDAIRQQHGQHSAKQADTTARERLLIGAQQRLKALETLELRRAAAHGRLEARREQRVLDDYATQLAARRRPGKERP
jgi:flagellar FliJ protein